MANGLVSKSITIDGVIFGGSKEYSDEGVIKEQLSASQFIPGKAGVLSTRGSDTAGTITGAGHGLTAGDKVSVFFTGGKRSRVVVGTIDGDDVPISGGAGDNLPLADAEVVICKEQEIVTEFDAARATLFGVKIGVAGLVQFLDTTGAESLALALPAGSDYDWANDSGIDNPFTIDNVTKIVVSFNSFVAGDFGFVMLKNSIGA